jgi:hypothetical protein
LEQWNNGTLEQWKKGVARYSTIPSFQYSITVRADDVLNGGSYAEQGRK